MRTIKYTVEDGFQCLEDLRETSSELSLVHIGRETCRPYHVFSGKRDEYIIHLILSGHGFYSVNGNTWPLAGGQMFLIYPHQDVVYCADSRDPWQYAWFGFSGSRAEMILKQCGFSKSRLILPAPPAEQYLSCFDETFEHSSVSHSDSLCRESILFRLLSVLCRFHSGTAGQEVSKEQLYTSANYVTTAVEIINMQYMHDITVTDIADQIGISRQHLNRLFQEELHLPLQSFLINFRMQKAASLLKNTALSVKEISLQVGYTDPLVFSKAFKNRFNLSPKNYREYQDELELRSKRFE